MFQATHLLKCLCNGLPLWQKLTPFLVMANISNNIKCNQELKESKNIFKCFNNGGMLNCQMQKNFGTSLNAVTMAIKLRSTRPSHIH